MSEREPTSTTYDRPLEAAFEDCTVWSDGKVCLPDDGVQQHDLGGATVDFTVDFGSGSIPITDGEVYRSGGYWVLRIPRRTRERYGIPCGHGATVDIGFEGVIEDG